MKKEDDLKLWDFMAKCFVDNPTNPSLILRKIYQYIRKYYVRKVK